MQPMTSPFPNVSPYASKRLLLDFFPVPPNPKPYNTCHDSGRQSLQTVPFPSMFLAPSYVHVRSQIQCAFRSAPAHSTQAIIPHRALVVVLACGHHV